MVPASGQDASLGRHSRPVRSGGALREDLRYAREIISVHEPGNIPIVPQEELWRRGVSMPLGLPSAECARKH